MAAELKITPFKFKFISNNQASGIFAKKGSIDGNGVMLDRDVISYDSIAAVQTIDNRMVLVLTDIRGLGDKAIKFLINGNVLPIEVYKAQAPDLKRLLNRVISRKDADRVREQLTSAGKASLFTTVNCPHCQSTIDQSERERTRYIYCQYCEAIFQPGQAAAPNGVNYKICGDCGMYDRVAGYTEFYFYFLLVVYGFSYKRRHVCDNCANSIFWKTLLANLIFVLGVPASLYVKIRSSIGRAANLQELPAANALALKGRYQEASIIYSRLHQYHPEHPGLLMNQGIGHLAAKDLAGGLSCFKRALKSCNNYLPAMEIIHRLEQPAQARIN